MPTTQSTCLCAVLALAWPLLGQGKPSQPLSREIVISDRTIFLPYLPESVAAARSDFAKVRPDLEDGLASLERTLVDLYGSPEAAAALPTSFRIPHSKAEALRFLSEVMKGDRYQQWETPFLKAWNEWQAVLLDTGLGEPAPATATAAATPAAQPNSAAQEAERKALKMRMKGMQKSEGMLAEEERILASMFSLSKNPEADIAAMQTERAAVDDRAIKTRVTIVTANRHAPVLAKAWSPLAEQLNADAMQLVDLDVAYKAWPNADFQALRVQAHIHFLERFREALWLSGLVWTRMAGATPPKPLRQLGQPAATARPAN